MSENHTPKPYGSDTDTSGTEKLKLKRSGAGRSGPSGKPRRKDFSAFVKKHTSARPGSKNGFKPDHAATPDHKGPQNTRTVFTEPGAHGFKPLRRIEAEDKPRDGSPALGGSATGSAPRAAAAFCVNAVENGQSLNDVIPLYVKELDPRDVPLMKELTFGVLRHRRLLQNTITDLLDRSISHDHNVARDLILIGIYQLTFTRVPARAAVASTVGACTLCHVTHLTGLVNAVLRRFLREGGQLKHSDSLAVEQSLPDWLLGKIEAAYPAQAKEIAQASNQHAPMWLRVQSSRIAPAEYIKQLEAKGIKTQLSPLYKNALRLEQAVGVDELPGFAEGLVCVQDLHAQLTAPLLELENQSYTDTKQRVLDACAAPGGKSMHILDLAPDCELICADAAEKRLERLKENFARLGLNAVITQCDFAEESGKVPGMYDRILIDAPCSGTGVIRRHPDIKWLRREKDLVTLTATQEKILGHACAKLNPGGVLVYTTCSILPEENKAQAEALLKRHPELEPLPFEYKGKKQWLLQVLPGEDGGDGFFYARFRKKS